MPPDATIFPDASGAAPALVVAGLGHAFGAREVLCDVSFTVPRGGFIALLGMNGAGKTTLFALITRLYHGTSGTITVLGHDLRRAPVPALARMGVVFQQPTLDLDLSVEENLFYHASLHGMSRATAAPRVTAELVRVGLEARRRDRARQLSGGQRRRVELARALLHEPDLLLLDEPTVGLDVESRDFLLSHVRDLCRSRGMGVLWATHLVDEVESDMDVIVLHQGRVRAKGPVTEMARDVGAKNVKAAFTSLTRDL